MIRLLSVPYHLGHDGVGMGAGPQRLLDAGADEVLRSLGHDVTLETVRPGAAFRHEVGSHFDVQAALALRVRDAADAGDVPVVLGGNCSSVLGVVAGLRSEAQGVIWFDAHADANTPDTTASGFLDGMAVAMLTGRCWTAMTEGIPGFAPLHDEQVLLAGVRSVDPAEHELLQRSAVAVVPPHGLAEGQPFRDAVSDLAAATRSVHVHVDLDVIDLADGRANAFAVAGGPSLDALDTALEEIGRHGQVGSISLTCYDPSVDDDGSALRCGLRLLRSLARLVPRT